MSQEHHFFQACAAQLSPGWAVQLNAQLSPGQIQLAERTARLYLVDTSTGWTAAGAFAPADFAQCAGLAKSAGLKGSRLADHAGQMLGRLGKQVEPVAEQDLNQCLQLVAAALAETRTFELVKGKGAGLAGHWAYLAYRGHDASITCRPVYFNAREPGFVPPETLAGFVRQVVQQDTRTPTSAVAQMLRRAGGVLLAPAFKTSF